MTDVVVDFVPTTIDFDVWSSGATAATPSTWLIAAASSSVSGDVDERPVGLIVRRFVPRPASRVVMLAVVPWPTPTRATTDATPITTPSIVSAARNRLVRSPDRARRGRSNALTPRSYPSGCVT